jgi:hypothetical protein
MSTQYAQVFSQFEDEVTRRILDAYESAGHVDVDGEIDEAARNEAVYEYIVGSAVVTSKDEKGKNALTRGDLYTGAFPDGPGAKGDVDALDAVDREAFERLVSVVWGLTQTARSGWVQRRLEADTEHDYVLCRAKIHRPADKLLAVYVTENESLIMEDAVDKEIKSLVRRATTVRRDLDMILDRHPKLRGTISSQLALEMRKVDAELTLEAPKTAASNGKAATAA